MIAGMRLLAGALSAGPVLAVGVNCTDLAGMEPAIKAPRGRRWGSCRRRRAG
jgi:hypothetical protein